MKAVGFTEPGTVDVLTDIEKAGKHIGEAHEQRPGHPRSVGWVKEL